MHLFKAIFFIPLFFLGQNVYACKLASKEIGPYFIVKNKQNFKEKKDPFIVEAAWKGDNKALRCAIKRGDSLEEKGFRGDTALIRAAIFCRKNTVQILVDAGAKANTKNEDGKSALSYLCLMELENKNTVPIAKILLNGKGDLNAETDQFVNILGRSMVYGIAYGSSYPEQTKLARELIKRGSRIDNFKFLGEWTPLLFSVLHKNIDFVKLLVSKGASVNETNKFGQSALDIAKKDSDVYKFLLSKGAKKGKREVKPWKKPPKIEYIEEDGLVGKTLYLGPEKFTSMKLYANFRLSKELEQRLPGNSKVKILKVIVRKQGESEQRRFLVQADKVKGWVPLRSLLCIGVFCDNKHPQYTWPFKIK